MLAKKLSLIIIPVLALVMFVYQAGYELTVFLNSAQFMLGHLALAFVLLSLDGAFQAGGFRRILWLLITIVSVAVISYLWINWDPLQYRIGYPNNTDLVVAIPFIALVIGLTWRFWGPVFPVFALVTLAYAFWGDTPLLGPLAHAEGGYVRFISYIGLGEEGIISPLLMLGAATIWIFIVFGYTLGTVRATPFFIEVGKAVGRFVKGGAAYTALVGSSLLGMCTGASVANVTITGTFTIPLMKKSGIDSGMAGAVECLASNGGQFVPPILGAAAFLMVGLAGIPYREIITSAIGVALLYYLLLALSVSLLASKEKWPSLQPELNKQDIIFGGIAFLVPIGLLVSLLYWGLSPARCGWYAFGLLLVLGLSFPYNRPSLSDFIYGLAGAIKSAAKLSLVVACLGVSVIIMKQTALVMLLGTWVEAVSGGELIIALIMTHLVLIILGCGMPTVVAYAVGALVCAPVLIRMGLDTLPAHFFVFYNAVFASVTPPIALTAVPASTLAGTKFLNVVKKTLILGSATYLLPYFFVYFPFILASPTSTYNVVVGVLSLLGAGALVVATTGFAATTLTVWERIGWIGATGLGLAAAVGQDIILAVSGAVCVLVLLIVSLTRRRRSIRANLSSPSVP